MDKKEFALRQHEAWAGKIEVVSRAKVETPEELSVAYTPGVAEPCTDHWRMGRRNFRRLRDLLLRSG